MRNSTKDAIGGIGLIVLVVGAFALMLHDGPKPSSVDIYKANVVKLSAMGGHGTGVYISPTHILTACHVVNAADAFVVTRLVGEVEARAVPIDQCNVDFDIGLLKVATPNEDFIPIEVGTSYLGQKVHSGGWGRGFFSFKQAFASLLHSDDTGNLRWLTSFTVNPGDSGSPVFNDDNELVGILSASRAYQSIAPYGGVVIDTFPNASLTSPSQNIKTFLKKWRASRGTS